MIVNAYSEMAGALICIHPTVADIFSLMATRSKLMGKKKKFNESDIWKETEGHETISETI